MSTLRETIQSRLKGFGSEREAAKTAEDVRTIEDAEAEFLLQAMPYIRQTFFEQPVDEPVDVTGTLGAIAKVTKKTNKMTLLNDFKFTVDGEGPNPAAATDSIKCLCEGEGTFRRDDSRGELACVRCGVVTRDEISHTYEGLTFNQKLGVTVTKHPEYKKINHFSDHLTKLQAKENRAIPEDVYTRLRAELKKNRVTRRDDITPLKIKEFLHKLNLSAYYENIYKIAEQLGGLPAPKFEPAFEAKLKRMFLQAQTPFEQCKPPGRNNFLSYPYTIFKFCELLGADEYLPYLALLKSSKKLQSMDETWQKMCGVLRWEFIPSPRM